MLVWAAPKEDDVAFARPPFVRTIAVLKPKLLSKIRKLTKNAKCAIQDKFYSFKTIYRQNNFIFMIIILVLILVLPRFTFVFTMYYRQFNFYLQLQSRTVAT